MTTRAPDPAQRLGDAHRPLREQVADELRSRIVDGRLEPGARLIETQLAEQLGVSRNPIREALRVLEAEGFVLTQPRRGLLVASLDEAAINDLFDVRRTLEEYASARAAERVAAGEVSVDRLRAVLDKARRATDAGDFAAISALNSDFHTEIVRLAGNALLHDMVRPMQWRVRWVFQLSAELRAPRSLSEHEQLCDAIARGEATVAGRIGGAHAERARTAALDAVRGDD
ncbi:GntR family transcriptional regulator [Flexivirga meconopsidis]|uniref:GntR family transcriptional regulator n=1 Tax=Flexivirga meconopsidis TaxID=2977121 RepID=UPI00223EB6B2|nr:GntR family transcriptional regulator [Flexivirga meconopsidis]